MKRRHLFGDVKNFLLYDFFTPEGYVNENVFAYSNRIGDERALVIYHNKYTSAGGWVRTSVAYSTEAGDSRRLVQRQLGEGLGLHNDPNTFCLFRDHVSGLEYIRSSRELCEKGLYVELGAFKYHVFIDFREVQDNEWTHYAHIANELSGHGVPNIEEAFKEMLLQPLQNAFKELVNADLFHRLTEARIHQPQGQLDPILIQEIEKKTINFFREVKQFSGGREDEKMAAWEIKQKLEAILYLPAITSRFQVLQPRGVKAVAEYLYQVLMDGTSLWGTIFAWLFVHRIGKMVSPEGSSERSHRWMTEWKLDQIIAQTLADSGQDQGAVWRSVTLIKLLTRYQRWFEEETVCRVIEALLKDDEVQQFIGVNRYEDILWFNKEAFEEMLWWMMLTAALEIGFDPLRPAKEIIRGLERCWTMIQKLQEAKIKSGYQVEKLLSTLRKQD
jgi:hypothetical protein